MQQLIEPHLYSYIAEKFISQQQLFLFFQFAIGISIVGDFFFSFSFSFSFFFYFWNWNDVTSNFSFPFQFPAFSLSRRSVPLPPKTELANIFLVLIISNQTITSTRLYNRHLCLKTKKLNYTRLKEKADIYFLYISSEYYWKWKWFPSTCYCV